MMIYFMYSKISRLEKDRFVFDASEIYDEYFKKNKNKNILTLLIGGGPIENQIKYINHLNLLSSLICFLFLMPPPTLNGAKQNLETVEISLLLVEEPILCHLSSRLESN